MTESVDHKSTTDPYLALTQQFRLSGLVQSPAEVHGTLYGILCARKQPLTVDELTDVILNNDDGHDVDRDQLRKLLEPMRLQALETLADTGFAVKLLLPPDSYPLAERVAALAGWCRGFIIGLVAAGVADVTNLPGDSGEAITDLLAISEVETDAEDQQQAGERNLFELEEFVRVAVQLIYEELQGGGITAGPENG